MLPALALAVVLRAAPAPELALDYAVDPTCPSEADFLDIVERDVGGPVVVASDASVSVQVLVLPDGDRFGMRFVATTADTETGSSDLRARECSVLIRAAALRTSLALVDAAGERADPPAPELEAEVSEDLPEVAPPRPVAIESPPVVDARSVGRSGPELRASVGGEFGGAGQHAMLAIAVGWRWPRAGAELRAAYFAPTRYRLDDATGAEIRVQLGTVTAAGCAIGAAGVLEIPVCLAVEAGGLRARGLLERTGVTLQPWVAALFRTGVSWWASRRFALNLNAEAGPLLVRPGVRLDGVAVGYRAGRLTGRISLGATVRLFRSEALGRKRTR